MLDFMPGEKLYAVRLDSDRPDRVCGCTFVRQNRDGTLRVRLINGATRNVPRADVYKDPDDARRHAG